MAPPVEEIQVAPGNAPVPVPVESPSSDTPEQNQDVTERAIPGILTRPSVALSQSAQSMKPSITGAVTQIPPGVAAAILAQPGSRKQTILTIQPDIEMQRSFGVQPNLKRFQTP